MKTIYNELSSAVVSKLSDRPEALKDAEYLKKTVAGAPETGVADVVDPAGRTVLNLNLPQQIVDALNLTLTADFLESEFYSTGLNTPGLIPNELRLVFTRILLNEVGHRETLLTLLGSKAIARPTFNFTAGGAIPDVFSNFNTFTALGHTFEDNGVRAIKGQAGNVMSDDFVLTTALRFHADEARHASVLRRLNGEKGWITLNQRAPNLPAAVQGVYDGEENTTHLGININGIAGYSAATISEAFDEPLTAAQVRQNVAPFIVS